MKRISLILFCLPALLLAGCRAKPQAPAVPQLRDFPYPAVPAVYTDPEERRDWILDHFWDAFPEENRHYSKERMVRLYLKAR